MGELTGGPKRRLWANPFREEPTVGAHHTRDHDDGENRRADQVGLNRRDDGEEYRADRYATLRQPRKRKIPDEVTGRK
jgi:hypothetical protein